MFLLLSLNLPADAFESVEDLDGLLVAVRAVVEDDLNDGLSGGVLYFLAIEDVVGVDFYTDAGAALELRKCAHGRGGPDLVLEFISQIPSAPRRIVVDDLQCEFACFWLLEPSANRAVQTAPGGFVDLRP